MNIAHFSDLHYSASNLEEADRCFGAAVDAAIESKVVCAVIAGDSTDHAQEQQSPALHALAMQLRRLSDHCPVLLLQGTFSHEPPGALRLFGLIGGRHPIHVADRLQQVALTGDSRWLASADWRFEALPPIIQLLATCIPTVNKAQVAAAVGTDSAGMEAARLLRDLLQGYQSTNQAAREAGIVTIGVGHGTVNGCISEHGVPMATLDHEFTTGALFAAGVDAFMLGHIHQYQQWRQGGQMIAYSGSTGRFHYGEAGEKGALHWEVRPGAASCRLVPTPARRTVGLCFAGVPDLDAIAEAARGGALDGAHVRVIWSVGEEQAHLVDRRAIAKLLEGAAAIKFAGRFVPVQRARVPGIATCTTVADKLAMWAKNAAVDPGPLVACLKQLEQEAPDAIAAALLRPLSGMRPAVGWKLDSSLTI